MSVAGKGSGSGASDTLDRVWPFVSDGSVSGTSRLKQFSK